MERNQDSWGRSIPVTQLVSEELYDFTKLALAGHRELGVFLHEAGGETLVNGGDFGTQAIQAVPFSAEVADFTHSVVRRLDSLLDLRINIVGTAEAGDIDIYLDSEIEISAEKILGLAIMNKGGAQLGWEIFLNEPEFRGKSDYLKYAIIHEIGHSLGLEHPFDDSDGDFFESRNSSSGAVPEETVMAYREPVGDKWPNWYSPSDINALIDLWGDRVYEAEAIAFAQSEDLIKRHAIGVTKAGTELVVDDETEFSYLVEANGSPDLIRVESKTTTLVRLTSKERWTKGHEARNVGSKTTLGTGQRIDLTGLTRYEAAIWCDSGRKTTVELQRGTDSAYFLHDSYSDLNNGVTQVLGSDGRYSASRLAGVSEIYMDSGGGYSVVDLTSRDFITGGVTVYGADVGTSVFWGSDGDDLYVGRGGDGIVFGGSGFNELRLGLGRESVQYRAGNDALDVVWGFNSDKDTIELWEESGSSRVMPIFTCAENLMSMNWNGNRVDFIHNENIDPSDIVIKFMSIQESVI